MKALLSALLFCAFSANVSAGLIQLTTDWRAGELRYDGVENDYSQQFGGKLSYLFEEGSNLISSMVFFDQDSVARFSLIGTLEVFWPYAINATPETATRYLGHEVDEETPIHFLDLQTGGLLRLGITEMAALVAVPGSTPTLDNYGGHIFGGMIGSNWGMSFYGTAYQATRTSMTASVPEPSTLALLGLCLAVMGLSRIRSATGARS